MKTVYGTDGLTPIYEENMPHRLWYIGDIWLGDNAEGKYVARVNDLVYDFDGTAVVMYKVVSVDENTLVPSFSETLIRSTSTTLIEKDILFGVGPGTQADTYRVYIDKSTNPYTLCVDQRLQINGTMTRYAKIFKGSVLNSKGVVVSQVYDNSGNFISENIPLETVALNNHDVYAIKSIPPCKTNYDLVDGEVVTAVIYSDDGGVVSKRQLLVEETGFIRNTSSSTKYISHISLESDFIRQGDSHVIEFPVNLTLNAINLIGVVHYSDGSTLRLPVDGTKFKLAGINDFVATIVGQKIELVLIYTLGKDEVAYGTTTTTDKAITEAYELEVIDPNIDLSVKLFAYPEWVNDNVGYKLNFYLYTQDRSLWYNVTDIVRFDDRTDPIDGTLYGYKQYKTVYINMKDVSPAYKSYIHVQNIEFVLFREPDGRSNLWKIKSVANENYPYYGENVYAIVKGDNTGYKIDLSLDKETLDEWLYEVYDKNMPMYDSIYETSYPKPSHFYLTVNGRTTKHNIKEWNTPVLLPNKPSSTINKNIGLRFTRETGGVVIQLMYTEMPLFE